MTSLQASIICFLIEAATDCNWPNTRDSMLEAGYSADEVANAVETLCDIAGMTPIITAGDFYA